MSPAGPRPCNYSISTGAHCVPKGLSPRPPELWRSCQGTDLALDVWAGVKRRVVGLLWISALKWGQASDSPAQLQLLFTSVLPLSVLCFVVLNYSKIAVSWVNPKAHVVLCWFMPSTEFSLMHTYSYSKMLKLYNVQPKAGNFVFK